MMLMVMMLIMIRLMLMMIILMTQLLHWILLNDDDTTDSASALNTTILLLIMMILMTQFLHWILLVVTVSMSALSIHVILNVWQHHSESFVTLYHYMALEFVEFRLSVANFLQFQAEIHGNQFSSTGLPTSRSEICIFSFRLYMHL